MKNIIIAILILAAFATFVWAATLTIDIPTADVPRVSEAFGSTCGLNHNANVNEVAECTRRWIMNTTQDYERRRNTATFSPTPLAMQPTPIPSPSATPTPTP